MGEARRRLRRVREPHRRPHLVRDGLGEIAEARLVRGDDALEEGDALLARRAAEGLERAPRRHDCFVDVGGAAEADAADGLLGRGIEDVEGLRGHGRNPLPVDVEIQAFLHDHLLWRRRAPRWYRSQSKRSIIVAFAMPPPSHIVCKP